MLHFIYYFRLKYTERRKMSTYCEQETLRVLNRAYGSVSVADDTNLFNYLLTKPAICRYQDK
jgi:hypothetical protein